MSANSNATKILDTVITGTTGTGSLVLATSPTLSTVVSTGTTAGSTIGIAVKGSGLVAASADTATTYGVYGSSISAHTGGINMGVRGEATTSTYENVGVYGTATAITGQSFITIGVQGVATTAGTGVAAAGYFQGQIGATADTASSYGVYGISVGTHAGGTNYGGYFQAGNGATNYAVYATGGVIYANSSIFNNGYTQFGVATHIFYDSSAAKLATFTKATSAVNYLDIANSATTTSIPITATGTDTNISINIIPKGTGGLGINTSSPQATLDINGSMRTVAASKSAAYPLTATDSTIYVTTGATVGMAITLPAASANTIGIYYFIYKVDGGVGTVAITPTGSDTINGVNAAKTIVNQWNGALVRGLTATSWLATSFTGL